LKVNTNTAARFKLQATSQNSQSQKLKANTNTAASHTLQAASQNSQS
jgi:hypothetical protein